MLKKMEKVRKKADNILETQDVSEKEKLYQIKSYVIILFRFISLKLEKVVFQFTSANYMAL